MASSDVTLRLLLLGEDKTASKAIQGVGKATDATTGKMSKWGTAGAVMKGALAAGIIEKAATAVLDFGRDSVEAYRDAAASQRQLEDAYKRFPALADVSIDKLREQAKAIQDKTGADADDIAAGQAVLARHKLTGKQLQEMTPLLVDYAKRTGKDMPAAASTLGKAMAGNGRAMKELGIKFKDTGDPAKNFEQIMAGLQEKVGGFAESEATTLDGKLGILQTKFGDVQEEVGAKLLPVLLQLADGASQMIDWVSENVSWLGPLATGLGAAAVAMLGLNAAMTANPIGIVVVALGALVGGMIWAYQNLEWFRDGMDAAFRVIGAIGRWLWNEALAPYFRMILNGFAWIVDGIAGMLESLGEVPGFEWAKDAAKGMRGMAQSARDAAGAIKDIPDAKPTVEVENRVSPMITKIDSKMKSLKDRLVKATAKGDTKEVDRLKGKIEKLRGKKIQVEAHVKKTGITAIKLSKSGQSGTGLRVASWRVGGRPTVGEIAQFHKDEFWVPDVPGTVISQSRSRALMGSGPAALAASSGASVVNNYFEQRNTFSPGADLRELGKVTERALMQVQGDRSGRPFDFKTKR